MDRIYLDANATTPPLPAVWEAMREYVTLPVGNPSSAHGQGRRARQALEDGRERVAALLGAHADEVVFTSGATEANNLAVFGLAGEPPGCVVTSRIEHPSVSEAVEVLRKRGFEVAYQRVGADGRVIDEVRGGPRLVTRMLVNHETGVVQPVEGGANVHCDAVQGVGKVAVDFHALGVATLSVSAHKIHGPPGIGALLVKRGTRLGPQLHGGHQQQGRRPGTEPVALVVGFALALEVACREREARLAHVMHLRDTLLEALRRDAGPVVVNGSDALPYTLNVSFPGLQGELLLMSLDLAGVSCSTGSACSSGSLQPSPTLRAMGVPEPVLRSALRLSFSATTTGDEVREAARRICKTVHRLRQPSGGR